MTLPALQNSSESSLINISASSIQHLTSSFHSWLTSKNYSDSTIRNYLSDLNAYFEFSKINPLVSLNSTSSLKKGGSLKTAPFFKGSCPEPVEGLRGFNSKIFSSDILSLYLKTISSDSNYSRYLSSLSKFFQFALDQGLISTNPLKAALRDKKPSSDEIINQYSEYLNKKHFSQSTIKNYLNDIKQFIDWSKKSPDDTVTTVSSVPFDKRGPEKKSPKFNFLIPLLSKGKAASAERDFES